MCVCFPVSVLGAPVHLHVTLEQGTGLVHTAPGHGVEDYQTGLGMEQADALLKQCGGEVKTSIVANQCGLSADAARQRLAKAKGHLRQALFGDLE